MVPRARHLRSPIRHAASPPSLLSSSRIDLSSNTKGADATGRSSRDKRWNRAKSSSSSWDDGSAQFGCLSQLQNSQSGGVLHKFRIGTWYGVYYPVQSTVYTHQHLSHAERRCPLFLSRVTLEPRLGHQQRRGGVDGVHCRSFARWGPRSRRYRSLPHNAEPRDVVEGSNLPLLRQAHLAGEG